MPDFLFAPLLEGFSARLTMVGMPKLFLNSMPAEYPDPLSIAELLRLLGRDPRLLAVEVNEAVVPRGEHAAYFLKDADRVEIVTLVGGG